jgi:GNAT superfamily N-acetyltransferase
MPRVNEELKTIGSMLPATDDRGVSVKRPGECTDAEMSDFLSLVRAGDEVVPEGLGNRLARAHRLLFLRSQGCLLGVAALKKPQSNYRGSVAKKAGFALGEQRFPLELGWIYVLPSARGSGCAGRLVAAAIDAANRMGVFATSRSDNVPMHRTLKKFGFYKVGKPFPSDRAHRQLELFIRTSTQ